MGILKPDGTPSENYSGVRDEAKGNALLGHLIRQSYAALFTMHPDAQSKEPSSLKAFFKNDAGVGDEVASRMMNTFLALCEQASFNGDVASLAAHSGTRDPKQATPESGMEGTSSTQTGSKSNRRVEVCVNVQVLIPEGANAEMIDSIFASMARHLNIA